MDEKKILIINLSKGRVGEGNANLIGSMLITKIYLAAMSRADASEKTLAQLPNFYLYVDEFQSFANKSFADILSEARKYKLNLTIAHQYIEQMEEEVRDAVFGNVGTMITFRVGAFDAEVLEKEFAPKFTAEDLVNLGFTQIYLKLMIDNVSSLPFSARSSPPIKRPEISFKEEIIEASRKNFARPRAEVEAEILAWHAPSTATKIEKPKEIKKSILKDEKLSVAAATKKTFFRDVKNDGLVEVEKEAEKKPNPFESIKIDKDGVLRVADTQSEMAESVKSNLPTDKLLVVPQSEVLSKLSKRFLPEEDTQRGPTPLPRVTSPEHKNAEHVSLQQLQKKNPSKKKDDKGPQAENLSELKKALQAIAKKPTEAKSVETETKVEHKTQPSRPVETSTKKEASEMKKEEPSRHAVKDQPAQPLNTTEEKKPKEIPEDVLRKILDVQK